MGTAKATAMQESMSTWDALLQWCCLVLVLVLLACMRLVGMPGEGRLLPLGWS